MVSSQVDFMKWARARIDVCEALPSQDVCELHISTLLYQ